MCRSVPSLAVLCRFVLCFLVVGLIGCDDDNPTGSGTTLVTIRGHVANIDDLSIAVGVRVWLLDTEYATSVPTGTDGAFIIDVPKGEPLNFVTDDFNAAKTNDWVPLICVEHPSLVAEDDIDIWLIHACPLTVGSEHGTVAALDNYLANGDADNGDLFVPTASGAAGGTLIVLFLGCDDQQHLMSAADFSVSIDAPEFPEAYMITENFFDAEFIPDPSLGPDIMYPPGTTVTDFGGMFASFGHPRFGKNEVIVTLTDADLDRALDWVSPITVPVRPGWYSLVVPSFIAGVPNIPVTDFFTSGCM